MPTAAPFPTAADEPAPAALLAQVADMLAWPLLVVARDGRLHCANRSAHEVLQRGLPLHLDTESRVCAPPQQQTALTLALLRAGRTPQLLHWAAQGAGVTLSISALQEAVLLVLGLPRADAADPGLLPPLRAAGE